MEEKTSAIKFIKELKRKTPPLQNKSAFLLGIWW